ncbi:transcriptional regulator [Paenibacillus polymyxa]|uniref:helix-turn-helix domain-containing protein n=1 Tax=Paenibacillus polymyxa TaxID=1406 RepID=UPI000D8FE76C|nr:helix-turn-helix transcriptional regulator [Paenibacillus polymyxa]SPY16946.1 transcriptional regulator [Paenibacillus polymyxa]
MNDDGKMIMADRIKKERESTGLSQEALAEKLNMKRTNVANYEAGRVTPPSNVLKELATIFGVDSDYLLGLSDIRKKTVGSKNDEIPDWATKKDVRDFKKLLTDDQELMFDGVPLDNADRQRINDILTGLFWEAKRLNKVTYGRKKNTNKGNSDKNNE